MKIYSKSIILTVVFHFKADITVWPLLEAEQKLGMEVKKGKKTIKDLTDEVLELRKVIESLQKELNEIILITRTKR